LLNLRGRISAACYATAAEGNSLDHLFQAIDEGTDFTTYAGIAHSNTFWKPGIAADGVWRPAGAATTLLQIETNVYGKAGDGDEQPSLMITTQAGYDFVWGQMQALQRLVRDDEMTKAGFEAFKFNRAVLVVDRNTTSQSILAINENWVDLVSH